jgi:hypothetical protein
MNHLASWVRTPGIALLLIGVLSSPGFAGGGRVEQIGAFTDQTASESLRGALEQKGNRVVLGDGSTLCDIWFRASLPEGPRPEGGSYSGLAESGVVGVISFPGASKDYRGQGIKPGAYTLRYTLHPLDGNHLGISPIRDFLLLTPVAEDKDIGVRPKYEELVKQSLKSSGTSHPSPLSLVPAESYKAFPSVSEDEAGHIVFAAKIKSGSADIPIALVVKGVAEQ